MMNDEEDFVDERLRPKRVTPFEVEQENKFRAESKADCEETERALIPAIEQYWRDILSPFIRDARRKKGDWETNNWLRELENWGQVPGQLRDTIKAIAAVQFGDFEASSLPGRVDVYRRAALLRSFQERLRPGDFKRRCETIMGQIRDRQSFGESTDPVVTAVTEHGDGTIT